MHLPPIPLLPIYALYTHRPVVVLPHRACAGSSCPQLPTHAGRIAADLAIPVIALFTHALVLEVENLTPFAGGDGCTLAAIPIFLLGADAAVGVYIPDLPQRTAGYPRTTVTIPL